MSATTKASVIKTQPRRLPGGSGKKSVTSSGGRKSYANMIAEAVTVLAERNGSSFTAIKKYLHEHDYGSDHHIKSGVKNAVRTGVLVQLKGVGCTGSFKLKAAVKKLKADVKEKAASTATKEKPTAEFQSSDDSEPETESDRKKKLSSPQKKPTSPQKKPTSPQKKVTLTQKEKVPGRGKIVESQNSGEMSSSGTEESNRLGSGADQKGNPGRRKELRGLRTNKGGEGVAGKEKSLLPEKKLQVLPDKVQMKQAEPYALSSDDSDREADKAPKLPVKVRAPRKQIGPKIKLASGQQ